MNSGPYNHVSCKPLLLEDRSGGSTYWDAVGGFMGWVGWVKIYPTLVWLGLVRPQD